VRDHQHSVATIAVGALVALGCGSGGGFPDASPQTGTFSASWSIVDTSGKPVACDQVSATMVEASTNLQAVGAGPTETFVCGLTQGTSEQLVPGRYDLGFTLVGTAGNLVTGSPQNGITINAGQNTVVPGVTFTIDATGNFSMTIAAAGRTANCSGAPNNQQIATTSIVIDHENGSCAPMTLAIGSASSYNNDCSATRVACIENDQTITATAPITSGRYTVSVRGQSSGGTSCWTANTEVIVPPKGAVATKTVMLTYSTGVMGCP
jgi:hypothetical protein